MTVFEKALSEYRAALNVAFATALTGLDDQMYRIHQNALSVIERRYAEHADPAGCRALIQEERTLHHLDGLYGQAVDEMREAFKRLVRATAP